MNKLVINLEDVEKLKALDNVLATYINSSPIPDRDCGETIFIEIVQTIIGQLVSTKAAATIYRRLKDLLGEVNELNFINEPKENIVACGVSEKKYTNIHKLASHMNCGILDFQQMECKSDEEIIELLCHYPGIGLWSAEMILIFGLKRPNVLSFGDLGIRRGICKIYGFDELSRADFVDIKDRLSPFGTIASLYFWQAYSGE